MKELTTRPILIADIDTITPYSSSVFNVTMKTGEQFTCDRLEFRAEIAIVYQQAHNYMSLDPL